MTFASIVVIVVKVLVAIAFMMVSAAVLTWADRRQGALVQDRIGPVRAVWFVPQRAVQVVLFLAAAAAAALLMVAVPLAGPHAARPAALVQYAVGRMTLASELAVLCLWFGLLLLCVHARRAGTRNAFEQAVAGLDPRSFFFGGIVLHLVLFPLLRLVPPSSAALGAKAAEILAGVLFMGAGLYAAARVPPGRVGIRLAGLIHPVADALKMIWKEDLRPKTADRLLFALGPMLALIPPLVTIAVIPFGSPLCFVDGGRDGGLDFVDLLSPVASLDRTGLCPSGSLAVSLAVADLNVGLLYVFAVGGMGVVAAAIAGWSSDNKFSLLGGLRAVSQMVSYEVAMGLGIAGLLLTVGSVHMQQLVDWQGANAWGIFVQPLGFVLFFVALVAETKRVPFDLPEGESEIVAGYFLEYSGMKFGMFYLGEFLEFAFSAVLLVTLFFGGYHLPFLHADGIDLAFGGTSLLSVPLSHLAVSAIHLLAFLAKCVLMGWLLVFIRWTLPRFRYDQLMDIGWKKLLPLGLANLLLSACLVLAIDGASPAVKAVVRMLGDLSQALMAVGGLGVVVLTLSWLVEPARHQRFLRSSAARYAAAAGGIKTERMGA
jgi:NADH-quinone oxidoreductase subunit H